MLYKSDVYPTYPRVAQYRSKKKDLLGGQGQKVNINVLLIRFDSDIR